MVSTREGAFAPSCALHKFETEAEVVVSANDASMGLASYFFTKNVDRTWRLLENLEAGIVGINTSKLETHLFDNPATIGKQRFEICLMTQNCMKLISS
jgi:acyl-CoA reductase-like NAD-dependent aldehyde dehydrogenase